MAHLRIPKTSSFIDGLCKDAGVSLKTFHSPEEFEREIITFMKSHDIVHLATSYNDAPRSTPLGYFNVGTTLYILSEGGGKFRNLKLNPNVSYSIGSRIKGGRGLMRVRGLQCWGKAEVVSMKKEPDKFQQLMDLIGLGKNLKKRGIKKLPPFHYRIIKIVPHKITLLDLSNGINNVTWAKK